MYGLKRAIAILIRCLTEENPREKDEEPGSSTSIPKVHICIELAYYVYMNAVVGSYCYTV